MSLAHHALVDLEALAYEAALEPSLWPQVIADASRAFEAPHIMLGVLTRRGSEVMRVATQNAAEVSMAHYSTVETNPGVAFVALTPRPWSRCVTHSFPTPISSGRRSTRTLCGRLTRGARAVMNVHRDNTYLAPMGISRTRRQRPFGEEELRGLRALAPHLNRALRVTLRLKEMEARASALAEMSDRALAAVMLTDAFGRVSEANGLARAILAEGDGLVIRDGVLRAARSDDSGKLARLILEAAGGVDGLTFIRKSGVMQVARPSCRRPLALVVSPTRNTVSPSGRSHAVTIAFADPERAPEADADLLARLYGFTAREAAVAALLLKGCSPKEAADEFAMSENTVRTHIRHVFEKTGVERLSDLVRLLMQGPGVRGR
jgi:DNA-binding CsgD family transcriptional regulator/PAS domain-containing protein